MQRTKWYRSIWISDVHLGTRRCKAEALLDFLRRHEAETLYLVGDIVDGWNFGPTWHWNAAQTAVVHEIAAWRLRGTRIIFLPGNHDEGSLSLVETLFGNVSVKTELVHRTGEGRRLLVTHGHQFDTAIANGRWMSALGAYRVMSRLDEWYRGAAPERERNVRLAGYLKGSVRKAVDRLTSADRPEFKRALLEAVRESRVDGVICGHIHQPAQFLIGQVAYHNDGDWVENCTALAENRDGELRLIEWNSTFNDVVVNPLIERRI